MRVLDLFSGIGGFSLGLEETGGFTTTAFCEINSFCRSVLNKHWPDVPVFEDVRLLQKEDVGDVDVITAGFPCQDLSVAGKKVGLSGERSGLLDEVVRLIEELRPEYVILENVVNLLRGPSDNKGAWFETILRQLAELGYDAEWENIPASALGAPHRRERVWIVAYPSSQRQSKPRQPVFPLHSTENESRKTVDAFYGRVRDYWSSEPDVGRVAYGVPDRMDRLTALGNSVVPQIPQLIGLSILERENT